MSQPWVLADDMFAAERQPMISQGDIYVLPIASTVPADTLPASYHARPPFTLGSDASVRIADAGGDFHAAFGVHVALLPVVVISHDCELDKEFNIRISELERDGVSQADAMARAETDDTLDRWVVVAPLLPPEESPAHRRPGIQLGQTIGYLPIPPHPDPDIGLTGFFVHLSRLMTIDRSLTFNAIKIASLSEAGRSFLRFKLAETHSSRALSAIPALEQAIGQRLVKVEQTKAKKGQASADLVFEKDRVSVTVAVAPPNKDAIQRTR